MTRAKKMVEQIRLEEETTNMMRQVIDEVDMEDELGKALVASESQHSVEYFDTRLPIPSEGLGFEPPIMSKKRARWQVLVPN